MNDLPTLTELNAKLQREYGLSEAEALTIVMAVWNDCTIEIDGIRNRPIGKSHLCDFLRNLGADAFETYETEEGGRDRRKRPDVNTNHAQVYIWLGGAYRGAKDD